VATKSLEGIWGLEQLDRAGLNTWMLGVAMLAVGVLLALIIIVVLLGPNLDSASTGDYSARYMATIIMYMSLNISFVPFLTVLFVRKAESDLEHLSNDQSLLNQSIQLVQPGKSIVFFILASFILLMVFWFPVLRAMRLEVTLTESFAQLHSAGIAMMVFMYLLSPLAAIVIGIFVSWLIGQIRSLIHLARHVDIDLFDLDRYASVANPAVRLILLGSLTFCFMPLMDLYIDDARFSASAVKMFQITSLVMAPVFFFYCYPVFILRNRIRSCKLSQLDLVKKALKEDQGILAGLSRYDTGTSVSMDGMLTRQMFLESRWEWPIATHIQRLILFGLLPPITWVLAATIENMLY